MRERRKEPREGSEIDPETACIQTVGALLYWSSPQGCFDGRARKRETHQKYQEGSEGESLETVAAIEKRWLSLWLINGVIGVLREA